MNKAALGLCALTLLQALAAPFAALPPDSAPQPAAQMFLEAEDTDMPAGLSLQEIVAEREILALVYMADTQSVYEAATDQSAVTASLPSGQTVFIKDVIRDEASQVWVNIEFAQNDVIQNGYILRKYIATSDERFLNWENENGMVPIAPFMRTSYDDVNQFPEAYQTQLLALKNAHPKWTFVPMRTGLDWNTVVANEMAPGRSLVPSSFDAYMKGASYSTDGRWYNASEIALKYYLDPRNWLNEEYIFQFELLTYNKTYHNESTIQKQLNNTFMAGVAPHDSRTYSRIFVDVGAKLGVSPFHLAYRAYLEQGAKGSSLVSGVYPGYEGLYNFYNINAAGKNDPEIIANGLTHARNQGWVSPALSIEGGGAFISRSYILAGQDTVYLQKFDVDGSMNGLYWHQYQQAIYSPATEAKGILNMYRNVGALNDAFVFKIPIYENMPGAFQILPDVTSFMVDLSVPSGFENGVLFIDGTESPARPANGRIVANAGGPQATTAVMYRYDANGIPIDMYVWTLYYVNGAYTITPVPELQGLLTYHGFSVRITGQSGIRFESGISVDLRNKLLSSGVAGFTLREYGTLVMTSANRAHFPFTKGGEKVVFGMAYGIDANGNRKDAVFRTIDGRYHFTSVLTGLPVEQYKTQFAFCGYIILVKNGREHVIYGPPVNRSIYDMATGILARGDYETGTDAYNYLAKIIADADGVPFVPTVAAAEEDTQNTEAT